MSDARTILAKRFRKQAVACKLLGSALYEMLLEAAARDALEGGPVATVMEPLAFAPRDAAIALKLMGSVHRLVLEGRAPDLAPFYPSVGGIADRRAAWPAFRSTVERNADELLDLVERPVQTNEVGRCGGLVGGFFAVAERTNLPLNLLELGASGGLNLRWDRYRYETPGGGWGPVDSPVRLADFEGSGPDLTPRVVVRHRRGCDPNPLDPTSAEGRLALSSYVWPDQLWRWEWLRGALQVAAKVEAPVDRAFAAEWLHEQLAERSDGCATVVFHSIVMQYLSEDERAVVRSRLEEAGKNATAEAPLAWLRMEPPDEEEVDDGTALVRLTLWPGGTTRVVARCGYHGRPVRWVGGL